MFNTWFAKNDTTDIKLADFEKNDTGYGRTTERNDQLKRLPGSGQVAADRNDRKTMTPPTAISFEQIYQSATVKPPKLAYGIQKVAEMGNSTYLAGMPPGFKQKAVLMALEATGTDVGEVLSDMVTRQRALKEYEETWQEKVTQFEAAQMEQNRLQKAELDRITSEYKARMEAGLKEVERWHEELREWQKSKQQEVQRLTDAAALCVPGDAAEEEENNSGKIMAIAQRVGGAYR